MRGGKWYRNRKVWLIKMRVENDLLGFISFADDQGTVAQTEKGLQKIMDAFSRDREIV